MKDAIKSALLAIAIGLVFALLLSDWAADDGMAVVHGGEQ